MLNILFFVDTPLQFYNAYLFASSKTDTCKSSILVYSQFQNAEPIANAYKDTGVFDQLYIVKPRKVASYKQSFFWQLSAIHGHQSLNLSELSDAHFDLFALACPSPATMEVYISLKKNNPKISTLFYEDGTGTYNGNVFKQPFYFEMPPEKSLNSASYINLLRKLSSAIKAPWRYRPTAIYVKKPALLLYQPNIPCKQISIDNNEITKLVPVLLKDHSYSFENARFLIFDVPRSETEGFGANAIDEILAECTKNTRYHACCLRSHPRSTEKSPFFDKCLDFSGGIWELMCHNENIANCLLIGVASTAQLAPYIEAEIRPSLLLLHRVAFKAEDQHYILGEQVLKLIKLAYGKEYPSKVYIPNTLDEALDLIKAFEQKAG